MTALYILWLVVAFLVGWRCKSYWTIHNIDKIYDREYNKAIRKYGKRCASILLGPFAKITNFIINDSTEDF